MSALDTVLADPTRCRVYDAHLAVHWYPTLTATTCHCGKVTRSAEQADEAPAQDGAA